ncbi:hypothetical protein [Microbacterium sp. G2-8]|uniref:hypothetical protein n=1 Tax=Microbacterium sp. G2-8 TaxID=2842454 RepID=UPI001C897C6E|nr:hypothetical protein [Microbacterium sp. G2-8]
MNEMDDAATASRIEAALRDTNGVATLFATGGVVAQATEAGARLIGLRGAGAPLVRVGRDGDDLVVEASIGVGVGASTSETARAAYDAVRRATADDKVRIRLTVVHVDASPTP